MCKVLHRALPIAYVDISFFAHATEDEARVLEAVRRLLPPDRAEDIVFEKSGLHGHYRNPILLFEARIRDRDVLRSVVENLASNLGVLDKETLLSQIGLHLEKGSLFIRLDKQAAFEGFFKLGTADPIRVRLRFKKNRPEDVVEICRDIGLLPR